jgi:chlorite dismutase
VPRLPHAVAVLCVAALALAGAPVFVAPAAAAGGAHARVVLGQSGLMKWATIPYSYLAMTKASEYSEESRLEVRPAHAKYLFVYPFVKTRAWYALDPKERYRIMQEHIALGREYPGVDNHTAYCFGLDDQEFVVAFDTDDIGAFLDLVQRLRTTEASKYTLRDTPSFTCIRASVERALNALDGEALTREPSLGD